MDYDKRIEFGNENYSEKTQSFSRNNFTMRYECFFIKSEFELSMNTTVKFCTRKKHLADTLWFWLTAYVTIILGLTYQLLSYNGDYIMTNKYDLFLKWVLCYIALYDRTMSRGQSNKWNEIWMFHTNHIVLIEIWRAIAKMIKMAMVLIKILWRSRCWII